MYLGVLLFSAQIKCYLPGSMSSLAPHIIHLRLAIQVETSDSTRQAASLYDDTSAVCSEATHTTHCNRAETTMKCWAVSQRLGDRQLLLHPAVASLFQRTMVHLLIAAHQLALCHERREQPTG